MISVETEEPTPEQASEVPSTPPKSPSRARSLTKKIKEMLTPRSKGSPTKSLKSKKSKKSKRGDDEDDEGSESLPPIPMQILVDPEQLEQTDSVEEQPQISGNSDEMYLKMKEAGITPEQLNALAEQGLTIAEG